MNEPVTFTVPGIAAPAGSKTAYRLASGKVVVVDACKRGGSWKSAVAFAAAGAMVGRQPMLGAVELTVEIVLPRPKSHYRQSGNLRDGAPMFHTSRPDATKLLRAIEDAITGLVWSDDAQVCVQRVVKRYATDGAPCVTVTAVEIEA